ncbi:outer membrane beta-barrel protein [Runella sp. MFBS21]|uniref:outer membrane beta-barrel protein n=1 Tax=Runella sp. MFBS21 TaxID=3034018 RepID=UPI0023F86A6B|nr:outer membrane beta-barrel protein [Runella sp. MFBS21]MDF7816349.1 outer membrane beta-barrel protein [Runella sp. MFBS21]
MKKVYSLIIGLLATGMSFAQQSFILSHIDHRGFVNLSGGVSMPVKSLMKGDPTAPSDVVALRGTSMQVSAGYRLTRRMGIQGSFTNCLNNAGTKKLVENIEKSHAGGNWSTSGGTWNCSHLMAGPFMTFSSGLFMFDARIMGGYSWIQRPTTELKGNFYDVPLSVKTQQMRKGSATLGGGASIRYKISRNFALALNADYVSTRASFDNLTSTLTVGKEKVDENIREVHPIGLVSINGGLSLLF